MKPGAVRIVGGGPTGALLASLLGQRGAMLDLYESRPDPRLSAAESGRSINLALADRGIHALKMAGAFEEVRPALVPMRGRMIHGEAGDTTFQPYGQRPREEIYSISRHRLNQALLAVAARSPGVRLHFEHRLESADFELGIAHIHDLSQERVLDVPMAPLLAADGAGSRMRRALRSAHRINAEEIDLAHGYKELSIAADENGGYRMAQDALHIWPRGDFMLIALPNADGSFTATLFLPKQGPVSFAALEVDEAVDRFFAEHFPDARGLMRNCLEEFPAHPTGFVGSVAANPWHHAGMAALIGDSAHAMVPFHGQGMNCCFEDCVEFDACVQRNASWRDAFLEFDTLRKPNTDAISAMALENYLEMRELVAEPKFQLQQLLSLELERRFPDRFIPRYSMVMFHHEIPYVVAQRRGAIQARILSGLTAHATSIAEVDFGRAQAEIHAALTPLSTPV